jgi:hypothetical protein
MNLSPLTQRPWYLLPALWLDAMDSISAKSYARLEAVRYQQQGVPMEYRDGFVVVQRPDSPEFVLATDLKLRIDGIKLLDAIPPTLPQEWPMATLSDQPTWYRRHGFRVPLPPAWDITMNVLYCPGGQWGVLPAIDLGAVSA